jgi:hypothetical protein
MSKEYPLYPKLTEQGEKEAQLIMDSFKPKISAVIDELMGQLYCDVAYYIESDSWTNYRNDLMDGFRGYKNNGKHQYDFKELRQSIYKNHKEEIIKDLNADLLEENEKLKKQLEELINSKSFMEVY